MEVPEVARLPDAAANFAGEDHRGPRRVKTKGPDGRVDLELWIENAGEVTVPGTATVILPVRS
jgi:hypothetical protein